MPPARPVVAVVGPTAAGKSDLAVELALRLDGEVVSADSMQAYIGLPILTAQPTRPTQLVGIWPLSHEGSVAEYARLAHGAIDGLVAVALEQRAAARARRDFATADAVRDQLREAGIVVEDTPDGARWTLAGPDSASED